MRQRLPILAVSLLAPQAALQAAGWPLEGQVFSPIASADSSNALPANIPQAA